VTTHPDTTAHGSKALWGRRAIDMPLAALSSIPGDDNHLRHRHSSESVAYLERH
jgi:hypothetical protein